MQVLWFLALVPAVSLFHSFLDLGLRSFSAATCRQTRQEQDTQYSISIFLMSIRFLLSGAFTLLLASAPSAWADPISAPRSDALNEFLQNHIENKAPILGSARSKPVESVEAPTATLASAYKTAYTNPSTSGLPRNSASPSFNERVLAMSDVVVTAMGYLDKPYSYGGQTMEGGFDCSGFVLSLFQRTLGNKLPRTAAEQAKATKEIDVKDLAPGDLVFFNTMKRKYSHVGIYVGDGRFIHSPRSGARIRIESMHTSYWKKRFDAAHRVPMSS